MGLPRGPGPSSDREKPKKKKTMQIFIQIRHVSIILMTNSGFWKLFSTFFIKNNGFWGSPGVLDLPVTGRNQKGKNHANFHPNPTCFNNFHDILKIFYSFEAYFRHFVTFFDMCMKVFPINYILFIRRTCPSLSGLSFNGPIFY